MLWRVGIAVQSKQGAAYTHKKHMRNTHGKQRTSARSTCAVYQAEHSHGKQHNTHGKHHKQQAAQCLRQAAQALESGQRTCVAAPQGKV